MKLTPVSNDPNAVVVVEIVEEIEGTRVVVLVEIGELQGVVLVVVKMVLLSPSTSMTKPPSLP